HLMHSNGSHDLEWGHHPTGGAYASIAFALPFDVPGAIARDPGLPIRFWVSGFDSSTGTGHIVSLLLNQATHTVLQEWHSKLGSHDPVSVSYNATENRLYYLEYG